MMRNLKNANSKRLKRFALIVCPIVCLSLCKFQPAAGFLHCFTPNMFKMGKVGHPVGAPPGERVNWYPQMTAYQGYGFNPMSRLFKPKWMLGGGLFGPKRWMDWRMNSAKVHYPYEPSQAAYWSPPVPTSFNYNQLSDNLNVAPYLSYPSSSQLTLPPTSSGTNLGGKTQGVSYGNQAPASQLLNNNYITTSNDGWTYPTAPPYQRPTGQSGKLTGYGGDSYSVTPNYQSSKQQADHYGTKGGGSGTKTAKKVLIADGI